MCARNLMQSDHYETADNFARDVRLIWTNCFVLFGADADAASDEWSRNRASQRRFEKRIVDVSRSAPPPSSLPTGTRRRTSCRPSASRERRGGATSPRRARKRRQRAEAAQEDVYDDDVVLVGSAS